MPYFFDPQSLVSRDPSPRGNPRPPWVVVRWNPPSRGFQKSQTPPSAPPLPQEPHHNRADWNLSQPHPRVLCLHPSQTPDPLPLRGRITGLAVTLDDRWLVSGAEDGKLNVWDIASAQLLRTILEAKGPPPPFRAPVVKISINTAKKLRPGINLPNTNRKIKGWNRKYK